MKTSLIFGILASLGLADYNGPTFRDFAIHQKNLSVVKDNDSVYILWTNASKSMTLPEGSIVSIDRNVPTMESGKVFSRFVFEVMLEDTAVTFTNGSAYFTNLTQKTVQADPRWNKYTAKNSEVEFFKTGISRKIRLYRGGVQLDEAAHEAFAA